MSNQQLAKQGGELSFTPATLVKNRWGSTHSRRNYEGERNPKWRGGVHIEKTGRVLIYSPEHPNANWKNYVYRYRLVMEKKLGRFLKTSELVHHKNGDCSDDRLSNLEVTDRVKHGRIHMQIKMRGKWSLSHSKCQQCKTAKRKHKARGFCEPCYEQNRIRK